MIWPTGLKKHHERQQPASQGETMISTMEKIFGAG